MVVMIIGKTVIRISQGPKLTTCWTIADDAWSELQKRFNPYGTHTNPERAS